MQVDAPVRVSVIVPTRGRPELLREALASIRAVESPPLSLEILVCDNGNGEGEGPAREFGARFLHVEALGAAAARNVGIRAATGEFITFLDDDDLWLPGHLEPKIDLLRQRPDLGAVVGRTVTTNEARQPTYAPWPTTLPENGDVFEAFLDEYPQIGSTVVRTTVRESVGLLDEALLSDEDWEWHLRLALAHKVGFVPVLGVLFRQRDAGTFDSLQWMRLGFMRRVLFRMLRRAGPRRPSLLACARIGLHHHWLFYTSFLDSALHHLYRGDRVGARHAIGCAVAASPIHAVLGLLRDYPMQQALKALLLGGSLTPPSDVPADDRPLALASADSLTSERSDGHQPGEPDASADGRLARGGAL